MNNKDRSLYRTLERELKAYENTIRDLPGINLPEVRDVFIRQIIDSIHRIKSVTLLTCRDVSPSRADPKSEFFDPLKAAIFFNREGNIDEAFWLTFLATHFGKSSRSGWRLIRDVYGSLGGANCWSWDRTSVDPQGFIEWLADNYQQIIFDGVVRFSNHRKFETLRPNSDRSTGKVVESYINWVGTSRSHQVLLSEGIELVGPSPRDLFHHLYKSMDQVISFGRLGKFDFLTMLAKLDLAKIEPGLSYMVGASGPKTGASLLFSGIINSNLSPVKLEALVVQLEANISVAPLGMQVLEDSLCNWQKNLNVYRRFNG